MMLPVSSYEDLLARVRSLTTETIQLHHEITSSLSSCSELMEPMASTGIDTPQTHHCNSSESGSKKDDEVISTVLSVKMCDHKDVCDEFLRLEDKFLEAEECSMVQDHGCNLNDFEKHLLKTNNNDGDSNFLDDAATENLIEHDANTKLDFMNQNFINARMSDFETKEKIKLKSSEFDSFTEGQFKATRPSSLFTPKEDELDIELKEIDEKSLSSPVSSPGEIKLHRKKWGPESLGLWHSGPSSLCVGQTTNDVMNKNASSDISFTSSINFGSQSVNEFSSSRTYSHQQLGAKVEMVYNLLSMLGTNNREDMSKTFLAMSSSPESCHAMRQSGCLPLLIQLIHSHELDVEVRDRAAEALYNIVHAQTDEKRRRREVRVLKLLQQVRKYCDEIKMVSTQEQSLTSGDHLEKHPTNAVGALMKFSFDAEHRQAICSLGGLHAITELIQLDVETHGGSNDESSCITLRRYAGMSLTNLTFGDGKNKAFLCSFRKFMVALVEQLKSPSEDLRQVTASVLRNLSWRADSESKQALRDVGAVSALTIAAMEAKKESTLKSILSALWNLSAHCTMNKVEICSVPGSLAFLVKMLKYKSTTNTIAVVENAGGIIRNISSHLAVREDYRQILRDNNCFEILLEHLKSPSLTIVSNACGTLWNLSARCSEDQKRLWEMGATSMLRSLVQSKHKMISMGSSAALKNLLTANPNGNLLPHLDSTSKNLGLQNLPTLFVRKQRALEQELDITLAETCDNIEPSSSPNHLEILQKKIDSKKAPKRSESHESIRSTQSDSACERLNQIIFRNENLLEIKSITLHDSLNEKESAGKIEDQKLIKRYKASMIPTLVPKKKNCEDINEKDKEENPADENDNVVLRDNYRQNTLKIDTGTEGHHSGQVSSASEDNAGYCIETNTPLEFSQLADVIASETVNPKSILQIYSAESLFSRNESKIEDNKYKNSLGINQTHNLKESPMLEKTNLERKNELKTVSEVEDVLHYNTLPCVNFSADKNRSLVDTGLEFQELSLNSVTKPSSSLFNLMESGSESVQKNSREFMRSSLSDKKLQKEGDKMNSGIPFCSVMSQGSERDEEDLKNFKSDLGKAKINTRQVNSDSKHLTIFRNLPEGSSEILSCLKPHCFQDDSSISYSNNGPNDSKFDNEVENLEKPSESTPNFKVGLEISESKFLQSEANKICREIKKYQEMEMGCSITSEISLVSCSSFLDTGDYSLFDFSSNTTDFSESENKSQSQLKNLDFHKNLLPLRDDSADFQSLGSLKNGQGNWDVDLENSIVSVASISSEIAETLTDKNCCNTYTKANGDSATYENSDLTLEDSVDASSKDETLNGVTLEYNMEFFDDDNSLHSQENLPIDLEGSKESRVVNSDKKLTPKERRKTVQERYKTYTIRDLKANVNAQVLELISGHEQGKIIAEQKKSNEFGEEETSEGVNPPMIIKKSKKVVDPSRFCCNENDIHKNDVHGNNNSTSINNLLNIGPAERRELADNAKIVAFSLKNAAQDLDSEVSLTSDLETEEPSKSFVIDTATYSKNFEYHCNYKFREAEFIKSNTDFLCGMEDKSEKKGPKISKTDSKAEDVKIKDESKGIRGRKKQLYSSPYRKLRNEIRSTPSSPKISHTATDSPSFNLTTTKSLPNVPKSIPSNFIPPALHREGTFTKDDRSSAKKTTVKSTKAIPVLTKPSDSKFSDAIVPTIRNKSMPSLKTGTIVSSVHKTRPLSATTTTNNGAVTRTVGRPAVDNNVKRFSSSASIYQGMKSSSSNQSIKSAVSERSASAGKLRNSVSQNLQGKPKAPKKEVTSKIASLWKKVEDAKQKSKTAEDTRVWIGPEKDQKISDGILVLEQEEILDIPTGKIIQSSTVQGLTISVPKSQDDVKLTMNLIT